MEIKRCSNGHFYNADRFSDCPHCGGAPASQKKETSENFPDDEKTVVLMDESATVQIPESLKAAVSNAMAFNNQADSAEEYKTVGLFSRAMGSEPVTGWLVAINGQHFGEDFRLKAGRNFIGRDASMDVCLSNDTTVSRYKHATIVYDPKNNIYLVQPGESKELCYLNDNVVLCVQEIRKSDILQLGESKLMFIPCCDETFDWNKAEK